MSNPQHFDEPDGDGNPSSRDAEVLTERPEAPVYLTRREAREAERAAEAAASARPRRSAARVASATTASAPATVSAAAAPAAASPASVRPAAAAPRRTSSAAPRSASPTRPSAPAGRVASAGSARRASGAAAPAATSASVPSAFRRTSKRVTVVGAMLFAGAMLVATSVPANAFLVDTASSGTAQGSPMSTQTFVAGGATDDVADRDGYSVTEMKVATQYSSTSTSTFSNDLEGTVQWPFQTGVPISSGFGARQVSNCSFCSTFHEGLDFVPGAGSPIQAIADGTVSVVSGPGGAFGNHVEIEHVINGQKVTSTYSHMQTGSVTVSVGDTVTVGTVIGKVGSTGNSTGAHLHFEIHLSGVPVDPYPWLQANTN